MNLRAVCFLFFLAGLVPPAAAQAAMDVGIEFQIYPTGILPGVRLSRDFGARHAVHVRLGANIFNHRDWGKHPEEKGSGWGGTLGYRHYFRDGYQGLFAGLRADVWRNTVQWKRDVPAGAGTSRIVVWQPTAEAGYAFVSGRLVLAPALAFGAEFNVVTDGEPTGEGLILLGGVTVAYRFGR